MVSCVCFYGYGDHRDLHVLTHSFPTRRSSDLARRGDVGVIFQQFNLVNRLSLLTNVLAGRLGRVARWRGTLGLFPHADRVAALRALERVGLIDQTHQRASTLSGGQQQRGAIARVLTQQARLILADEPIASLDPASARLVRSEEHTSELQ